ncbi:MAG: hypothetical protein RBU30_03320 [Polyangia bacterium]|jgi:uncharacterized membrane protein|nr:hypothetical protein [Polyangia bacterium]
MSSEVELVWNAPFGVLGWAIVVLGAAVVLVLGFLSTSGRSPGLRATLLGLRVLAVAGLAMVFLRPSWRRADLYRGKDHLVILMDSSASMGLQGSGGKTRLEAARAWLEAAAPSLERLRARHLVSFATFDASLVGRPGQERIPRADASLPLSSASKGSSAFGGGAPSGRATDLMGAIEALRSRYPGRRLSGVVVLSDGRDTAALRQGMDAQAAARLRSLDVPVNVVPLGSGAIRDAAVAEVVTEDLAFVRNATTVRVSLRVVGTAAPVQAELWIDGALKESQKVYGGAEREVSFSFVPQQVGQLAGRVIVRPVEGEATRLNNERRFVLRVVRDRVRVLQIAGRPSWDVRFLRQHFKRDPNVDLVSFFILRTHLNITAAASHELSLIQFPAEELFSSHLDGFDLVVMQDFERYPPYIGRYLDNIAAWVGRGGALALTGGEQTLSLGGFAGSRLAAVLPVELLPEGPPSDLLDDQPFAARPTPLAARHPVTRGGGGDGLSPETLGRLPELEGVNKVARAHPEAAVLAEHPRLRGTDAKPLPVIAVRDVEAGRSLAFLTDTSWRWRFQPEGEGPGAYDAFWRRAVRYLIGDPEFGRLRLLTSHDPYPAGGPSIRLTALATDVRREPAPGVRISWRLLSLELDEPAAPGPAPSAPAVTNPPASSRGTPIPQGALPSGSGETDAEGRLAIDLGPLRPGAFRLEAKAVMGGRQERAQAVMVAEGSSLELARVEPAPELLAALALSSGGRVLERPEDLLRARAHPPRVLRLERLRIQPLIGSLWLLLGVIVLALGAEWALRRRHALA